MPRFYGKVVTDSPTLSHFEDGSHLLVVDSKILQDPLLLDPLVAINLVVKIAAPKLADLVDSLDWIDHERVKVHPETKHYVLDVAFLPRPLGRATQEILLEYFTRLANAFPKISLLVPDPNEEKWQEIHALALPLGLGVLLQFQKGNDTFLEKWKTQNIDFVFIGVDNTTEPQLRSVLPFFPHASVVVQDPGSLKFVAQFSKKLLNPTYNMLLDPLQPLKDDLALIIYDEFEKDHHKYNQYKGAIELALEDLTPLVPIINILVVGPGRGKLIEKLFEVVGSSKVSVTAVEKNGYCMPILKQKNSQLWGSRVRLILDDIRICSLPENPHLVISELLGSFGDNELSSEILSRFNQASQRPLLMIPSSYSNFLQPIFTNIITDDRIARPYLANLTIFLALAEPTAGWVYFHPSDYSTEVTRTIRFISQLDYSINAFYGFFKSNLYGHFNISILNEDKGRKEHCFSWYPMLFPVKATLVSTGEEISIKISRKHLAARIWYEWEFKGQIYNKDGINYYMVLT